MQVKFSILSYFPSFITNESINVGILFHNIDNNIRVFETTTNWARIKAFDDELDIEYLKLILKGIENEVVNVDLTNYKKEFNLKEYTHFYVNELKFSDVMISNTDNFKEFIKDTKKVFLRYDYDRKDRPNIQQQISYIKNLLKDNSIDYEIKDVKGIFEENVRFDYIIDNYAFKLFTFENKRLNNIISNAKSWAFTAEELKDTYKIVFIYDVEIKDNPIFNSIINILSKSAFKVMKLGEAIDFLLKFKMGTSKKENYKLKQQTIFEL